MSQIVRLKNSEDGTPLYPISANGNGFVVETVLLATNLTNLSSGNTIKLSQPIDKFYEILILASENENSTGYYTSMTLPVSLIKETYGTVQVGMSKRTDYLNASFTDSTTLTYRGTSNLQVRKIYGVYAKTGDQVYTWRKYRRKLYLYKNGNENTELTGGWAVLPNDSYVSTDYSFVKNSTNMTLTRTQVQRFRALATTNLIDITEYTSVHLDYSNFVRTDSNATIQISIKNTYVGVTGDWGNVTYIADSTTSNPNLSCDISAYTDNYDIAVGIGGGRGSVDVNKVWLEGNIYLEDVHSNDPNAFPHDGLDADGEFYYKMIV